MALADFECPKCKSKLYDKLSTQSSDPLVRLAYWHMLINPGLAVNELFFGQRFPTDMYLCKSCVVPMVDRTYVHCPDCDTFLPGRLWSQKNAFGHWMGLYCPDCGGEIPALLNFTSRFILECVNPLLRLPRKQFGERLKQNQIRQLAASRSSFIDAASQEPKKISYIAAGFQYGLLLGLAFTFAMVVFFKHSIGNVIGDFFQCFVINVPIWIAAGLAFGIFTKLMMDRAGNAKKHLALNADGTYISSDEEIESAAEKHPDK